MKFKLGAKQFFMHQSLKEIATEKI